MAQRHGYSEYPFVVIDYPYAESLDDERLEGHLDHAWPQIQQVLLNNKG